MNGPSNTPKIFISHARSDTDIAQQLAAALGSAGFTAWIDTDVALGAEVQRAIDRQLRKSDVVLVVLSQASAESVSVMNEVSEVLTGRSKTRQVPVIAAVLDDVELPSLFGTTPQVDLRRRTHDQIDAVVRMIAALKQLDFARLDSQQFEALVGDLLKYLSFDIIQFAPETSSTPSRADFEATYQVTDPFGSRFTETWLIEAKHHSGRVGVDVVAEFAGVLLSHPAGRKGAIVTSGSVTSVVREYLSRLELRRDAVVRIVDGMELKGLITRYPELAEQYFGGS